MKRKSLILLASLLLLASCGGSQPEISSSTSIPDGSSSSKASYLITFKDEEGEVLESKKWEEGQIPSYHYEKEDTQEWDYTVQGWSITLGGEAITIPAVTGEATYYAAVSKVKQRYTITFDSNGGSDVAAITADYGTAVAEPDKPKLDKHKFVAWSYDKAGTNEVRWPITLTEDVTLYANWNETVDIKGYLASLIGMMKHDPYGYIPAKMLPTYSGNQVSEERVTYDFAAFNNVASIEYGGYGEQWNMVVENLRESERFYAILAAAETVVNASVIVFNNYLDNNPSDTAEYEISETAYSAKLDFHAGLLSYVLQYKTGWEIPFFGEVLPQIDMKYNVVSGERSVRIQLSENNAMRYVVKKDSYAFGLEYGVTALSRKAYFQIDRLESGDVEGHIYEYVQFKDKDLVPACADFYIGEDYVSVVGNKASGMPGFTGYINELYKRNEGKLLGYEVRETLAMWGFTATYHTLWFNLNDISGIYNVKAIKNDSTTYGLGGKNNHDIYLNDSESIFEPTYNKKALVKTSRKYDVEMRKQSFYGYKDEALTEFQVEIPMMFIQADHDGYTNFTDFPKNILETSGITASVTTPKAVLDKIQDDYATLIDVFIENKDDVTGDTIEDFIGNAEVI